jgi:UDP-GlcNAc:undecaprenyl-phosphate/decaprenyl-phosphate GlcNAc-1-phosphate transferase
MPLSEYTNLFAAAVTAFLFVYYVIPSIIKIAEIKHLYDDPDHRKSHTVAIPNLGGIAIFGGFLVSFCLFCDLTSAREIQYILAALCLVFMLGAKDDLVELTPYKKFIGQFLVALIITYFADIRISSFYGVLGISEIPYWLSLAFSTITIVFIINAFNLIDGINWLASGITLVITATFGTWFWIHGFAQYAIMSAAVAGGVLAFMRYNYTPARIFMGDSGSLSIGLIAAVLAIAFIEKSSSVVHSSAHQAFYIPSAPSFAIAVLIIPIFDTLRVFATRILKKKSPFHADRTHVHHKLLDLGLTHIQASFVLVSINIGFVAIAYLLQDLRNALLAPIILSLALILSILLFSLKNASVKVKAASPSESAGSKLGREMVGNANAS